MKNYKILLTNIKIYNTLNKKPKTIFLEIVLNYNNAND